MKDSDSRLLRKFKANLEKIKTEVVAIEDDYVMIKRSVWEDSQKRYRQIAELQKAIYGRIN